MKRTKHDEHEVRKAFIEDRMIEAANHQDQEPTKEQLNIVEGELVQWEKKIGKGRV